jgi:FHA domain
MADPVSIPLNFKIYRKDATGKPIFDHEENFDQEVIKVGKGSAANLRLDDTSVALMHAYIQINADKEVYISDVVSKTGTFVNGEKVNKAKLKSRDEIILGNFMLVVTFETEAAGMFQTPNAADGAAAQPGESAVGASAFVADQGAIDTFDGGGSIDVSQVEDTKKKQAVVVTSYYDNVVVQKDVLTDHIHGEKPGTLAFVAMIFGLILILGGLYLGSMSVRIVNEEESVNAIIKEIAKDRGLSDKFVPKVKGEMIVEMGFILLSLLGTGVLVSGMASMYKKKSILANFTIGEDPTASFSCSSYNLPDPKFHLVKTDRSQGYHLLFSDQMQGSITDPDGKKYMLTELVSMGAATISSEYSNTTDYPIPENYTAELKMGDYKWVVQSVNQPKLVLPFTIPKEVFYVQLFIWIAVVTGLASYFNYIQKDDLFNTDPDQQEMTFNAIVKVPDANAKKKEELKKQKQKDKDKAKDIYKKVKSKNKDDKSAPRDTRTKPTPGQGGASAGISRLSGPQGMGVANVLASQISAMTASLTASNTVFGQETEDMDDLLGDGDPDGEAMDGGFGGRGGAGGGGGGGGLGIGGGGGTGFGGIGIGGGGGLGGKFGKMGGIGRRKIRVRSGSAAVFGKLDPNEVRAVIRAHRREVHHCYQKGLMANDKLAGTVRVSFFINPAGRVQSCSVTENLAVPKVGNCICGRLRTWKFPQPQGGLARVAYAWTLQPGG